MLNLPQPIVAFLCSTIVRDRSPAYLQVNKEGDLLAYGGACDRYGLDPLNLNQPIDDQIFFLAGLLPLQEAAMHIPFLQLAEDIIAEVHIFAEEQHDWVVLFDATSENEEHVLIQQKINDLSLLRRKQARSLGQLMQPDIVAENILDIQPAGEQKLLTLLVIKCCNIAELEDESTAANPLKVLDAYLSAISPSVLDEGGIIHQSIGNSIVAVFGLLPSTRCSSLQAVNAGIRILDLFEKRQPPIGPSAQCALVIATGMVTVGLLQAGFGKTLTVMGPPMDVAVNLNKNSQPETLIIDKQTFDRLDQKQKYFLAHPENTITAFSPLYSYCKL